jgi:hypothetical protein
MTVFTVQAPDGTRIKVDAVDEVTAIRGAQEHYASLHAAAPAKPNVAEDVVKGAASGLRQGVTALPGVIGDTENAIGRSVDFVGRKVVGGLQDLTGNDLGAPYMGTKRPGGTVPEPVNYAHINHHATGDDYNALRQRVTGADYVPQTEPGRLAASVGRTAPAAFLPGSAASRVANVVGSGLGSEGARYAVEKAGGGEVAQNVASVVGGLAGGVAANVRIAPRSTPRPVPPTKAPTLEELQTQRDAAYSAVRDAGVQYRPEATTRLVQAVRDKIGDDLDPDLHGKLTAVVKRRIDGLVDKPATLDELDKVLRVINEDVLTPTASKGERRLGYQVRDTINDFIAKAGEGDVLSNSDPAVAAAALKQARDLHGRIAKMEKLEEAKAKGYDKAKQAGAGGNVNNAIRQQVAKVRDRDRGWTPDERAALDTVVQGDATQNALRQVGKLSPSGNGLSLWMNLGAAAKTGGLSLPITAAGAVSKAMADGMTQGRVDQVMKLVASGGRSETVEIAKLAARDARVANLVDQIRRVSLNSSTRRALSGATSPGGRPTGQQSTNTGPALGVATMAAGQSRRRP